MSERAIAAQDARARRRLRDATDVKAVLDRFRPVSVRLGRGFPSRKPGSIASSRYRAPGTAYKR